MRGKEKFEDFTAIAFKLFLSNGKKIRTFFGCDSEWARLYTLKKLIHVLIDVIK
jgi:hypothetical protein